MNKHFVLESTNKWSEFISAVIAINNVIGMCSRFMSNGIFSYHENTKYLEIIFGTVVIREK